MDIALLINRVGRDYVEMPGLELTLAQAGRLWNLSPDDCRSVVEALTNAGFLKWTIRKTLIRTGNDLRSATRRAS